MLSVITTIWQSHESDHASRSTRLDKRPGTVMPHYIIGFFFGRKIFIEKSVKKTTTIYIRYKYNYKKISQPSRKFFTPDSDPPPMRC